MTELDSVYNPKTYEKKWWNFWHEKKYFHADVHSKKPPYVILMPPPNITSSLHMGHGLGYTTQDILIRWKRMKGFNACWLPGTDHAGIATQMMVEKALQKEEGKTKKDLGRPEFENRLHAWKEKYGGLIIEQFKGMGFSCDWSRLAYTMDPGLSRAVRQAFVTLFEEGLIYRGERLVNWDTVLQTAISDDEVLNEEQAGYLWLFQYPVTDDPSTRLTVATTRPETMLGDTAVAVHPKDPRYQKLIGKSVTLPLVGRKIPIIADEYVDMDFGTGVVKITPAHDPNDFKIGKKHGLPFINVMNLDGTMAVNVPERFRGLDRFQARKEVVRAMKELDLFEKEVGHKHSVPISERSKTVIEPRLSLQWFLKMKPLAEPAIQAAKSGELRFFPDTWKKAFLNWNEHIEDWCISRQLWWGHRIPIWHCQDCKESTTGMEDPTQCKACGSSHIQQDEDVLDTWFSSWLWPLSPFGWPENTKDLQTFFPSAVLVTAPEIINLWVARMIMAGFKFAGKLAFRDVYFNATVCDKQGRKFSKTLGNGIDPLEVIHSHGADAVRFSAVSLAPLGGRVRMAVTDFDNGSRFMNKIWNATRFIMRAIEPGARIEALKFDRLDLPSKWLLTEFRSTTQKINHDFENYRINEGIEKLYHFIWGSVCDWGIECAKESLTGSDISAKNQAISLLVYVLDGCFRLASPVIPFLAEELWHKLPHHPAWDRPESLVIAEYPDIEKIPHFEKESADWAVVQEAVNGIRSIRSQAQIPPRDLMPAYLRTDAAHLKVLSGAETWIKRLTFTSEFKVAVDLQKPGQSLVYVGNGFEAYVPVSGVIDIAKEKARLEGEIQRVSKVVAGIQGKLSNANFVERAPPEVIADTKAQFENMNSQLMKLRASKEGLI